MQYYCRMMCFIISAVGILTFLTLNLLNNTMKTRKTLIFPSLQYISM